MEKTATQSNRLNKTKNYLKKKCCFKCYKLFKGFLWGLMKFYFIILKLIVVFFL